MCYRLMFICDLLCFFNRGKSGRDRICEKIKCVLVKAEVVLASIATIIFHGWYNLDFGSLREGSVTCVSRPKEILT